MRYLVQQTQRRFTEVSATHGTGRGLGEAASSKSSSTLVLVSRCMHGPSRGLFSPVHATISAFNRSDFLLAKDKMPLPSAAGKICANDITYRQSSKHVKDFHTKRNFNRFRSTGTINGNDFGSLVHSREMGRSAALATGQSLHSGLLSTGFGLHSQVLWQPRLLA